MSEGSRQTVSDLGEFALLERIARRLPNDAGAFVRRGIGDDCAVLRLDDQRDGILTTDALVERVHFRRDWTSPRDLGWKAVAVNLSDLAAMGAEPRWATLALALPSDVPVDWVEGLYTGVEAVCRQHGLSLVGGDTTQSRSDVMLSVTAFGEVPTGTALLREGAQVGDVLLVTGSLGSAAAGLRLLGENADEPTGEWAAELLAAHFTPEPRVAAGLAARRSGCVHAAIDLSDGLAGDLGHVCQASGVGAEVELSQLPITEVCRSAATRLGLNPVDWAVSGGEDYELLFAVPPQTVDGLEAALAETGTESTVVGHATGRVGPVQGRTSDGRCRPLGGAFDHFAKPQSPRAHQRARQRRVAAAGRHSRTQPHT